jgi:hypothetical protein
MRSNASEVIAVLEAGRRAALSALLEQAWGGVFVAGADSRAPHGGVSRAVCEAQTEEHSTAYGSAAVAAEAARRWAALRACR